MKQTIKHTNEKHICIGLLANVDAGKTTLSEALLYMSGAVRKYGKVDDGNAFFDNHVQERKRGITIFSKQAEIVFDNTDVTLVDTPGHVDFVAETERMLQILDYAVLIIDGKRGVQGHTKTLISLMEKYSVPFFVFVNKMDMYGVSKADIFDELKRKISERCVDFSDIASVNEELAMCSESLMEEYLNDNTVSDNSVAEAIKEKLIIPCYFGSAIELDGIELLMDGINRFTFGYKRKEDTENGDIFGAKVYKISRDAKGNRLTYLKITGGSLFPRQIIYTGKKEEKVNELRIYSGSSYKNAEVINTGELCAVTGLKDTFAGQGLGFERDDDTAVMEPALSYAVIIPKDETKDTVYKKLMELAEEEPNLKAVFSDETGEITLRLMGEVQLEVVRELMRERFDLEISFGKGKVSYRESILNKSIGIGHFEPLRHYAEVQLLLEPGEIGSGIVSDTLCSDDSDGNWHKIAAGYLEDREYKGVLIGAPLTDIKISVIATASHIKHTESGDFREAVSRAVRNGLLNNKSVLLEPWYRFEIRVPKDLTGKVMNDISKMSGAFSQPEHTEDTSIIKGRAPVSEMMDYAPELRMLSGGQGILTTYADGYDVCHNAEEIIKKIGYDPLRDVKNTGDSVFCSNGSGFTVLYKDVAKYAHTRVRTVSEFEKQKNHEKAEILPNKNCDNNRKIISDKELKRIFEKTYGKEKDKNYIHKQIIRPVDNKKAIIPQNIKEEYLLVDGYNVIHAWKELKELADADLSSARTALAEIISNYVGYKNCNVIVVFDAYKIKGGKRKEEEVNGVKILYTAEGETADSFIERFTFEMRGKANIKVATSDNLEQQIVVGNGALKINAEEFKTEIEQTNKAISKLLEKYNRQTYLNTRKVIGDIIENKEKK